MHVSHQIHQPRRDFQSAGIKLQHVPYKGSAPVVGKRNAAFYAKLGLTPADLETLHELRVV
ncbi:hypothetical protein [Cupriavidus basilensis]|uniref:Uncharacterized protein n=1 Tax=Cupriavidus basilensis TaxID=68895 RepID=A0A0C4YBB9_9BURK|nr:hypothetical protein [Cupriavidus basilensis]AJG20193.1 hypothetical protein RR42_m2814 [Cupriavidus basilensis]